jgi:hypothetical protein
MVNRFSSVNKTLVFRPKRVPVVDKNFPFFHRMAEKVDERVDDSELAEAEIKKAPETYHFRGTCLERAMGLEPTTSSLGSWHSTTELRPLFFDGMAVNNGRAPSPKIHQFLFNFSRDWSFASAFLMSFCALKLFGSCAKHFFHLSMASRILPSR